MTMADNRKQQRCEGIWLYSHLRAALAVRLSSRKWLAFSHCANRQTSGQQRNNEEALHSSVATPPQELSIPFLDLFTDDFLL